MGCGCAWPRFLFFLGRDEGARAAAACSGIAGKLFGGDGLNLFGPQPIKSSGMIQNWGFGRGFVKMSAQLSLEATFFTLSRPSSTWFQKWCHLIDKCLVCGWYLLPSIASVRAAELLSSIIEAASLFMQCVSPEQRGEARFGTLNLRVSSSRSFLIGISVLAH